MQFNFDMIPQNNRYGYCRFGPKELTENCSLDAQKSELIKFDVPEKNIYFEIGSASNVKENRPIFFRLINQILKKGDLLIVTQMDRCCRDTLNFLKLKNQLTEKGIAF